MSGLPSTMPSSPQNSPMSTKGGFSDGGDEAEDKDAAEADADEADEELAAGSGAPATRRRSVAASAIAFFLSASAAR